MYEQFNPRHYEKPTFDMWVWVVSFPLIILGLTALPFLLLLFVLAFPAMVSFLLLPSVVLVSIWLTVRVPDGVAGVQKWGVEQVGALRQARRRRMHRARQVYLHTLIHRTCDEFDARTPRYRRRLVRKRRCHK